MQLFAEIISTDPVAIMIHPSNRLNAVTVARGQTRTMRLRVKTAEGRVARLQDARFFMTVRKNYGTPILVTKTSDSGIRVSDLANGEVEILLTTTDTDLDAGQYRYDVWMELPGTPPARYPIVEYGQLEVRDSVTQFGA